MSKLTNLTVKGQVTNPKDVRNALGLVPGDRVEFSRNERGETVIRKATVDEARRRAEMEAGIARAIALFRPYRWNMPTDEIMKELRGDEPFPQ